MDLIFKCPKCGQELEVDASGAGEEITCPSCNSIIVVPEPSPESLIPPGTGPIPEADVQVQANPLSVIATSAAAKEKKHLVVPVHATPSESLITKAAVPLEVAALETDKHLRVKTIRHVDCVEVGHDRFDETVSKFLEKVGERGLISVTTISYSHIDIGSQKLLADYGVMILYRG